MIWKRGLNELACKARSVGNSLFSLRLFVYLARFWRHEVGKQTRAKSRMILVELRSIQTNIFCTKKHFFSRFDGPKEDNIDNRTRQPGNSNFKCVKLHFFQFETKRYRTVRKQWTSGVSVAWKGQHFSVRWIYRCEWFRAKGREVFLKNGHP